MKTYKCVLNVEEEKSKQHTHTHTHKINTKTNKKKAKNKKQNTRYAFLDFLKRKNAMLIWSMQRNLFLTINIVNRTCVHVLWSLSTEQNILNSTFTFTGLNRDWDAVILTFLTLCLCSTIASGFCEYEIYFLKVSVINQMLVWCV